MLRFPYQKTQSIGLLFFVCFAVGCGPVYEDADTRFWLDAESSSGKMSESEFVTLLGKEQRVRPAISHYQHIVFGAPISKASSYRKQGMRIRENPPILTDQPTDWAANPADDENWLFQKNALYVLQPFTQSFSQSADPEDFVVASRVVMDWIDFNLTRNLDNSFKWYDMSTGIRATVLAFVLDHSLRSSNFDLATIRTLIRAAALHAKELADPDKLAKGNHAYFQLVGLGAICQTLPAIKQCPAYLQYSNEQMERLIFSQFTGEGIQREHAPDYHFFSLSTARKILDTGLFSISDEADRRLRLAEVNKDWLYHPNGTVAMIGDTARGPTRQGTFDRILETDPHGQYGKLFLNSGYAVLRSPWMERPPNQHSYLIFWAGEERPGEDQNHSYGHSHADNFTFEWSEYGIPVLVDSGKFSYENNEWRDFFVSTRAHNTIEIDGEDYDNSISVNRRNLQHQMPKITAFESGVGLQHVEAVVGQQSCGVHHRRLLVQLPGAWLAVIDVLTSDNPHRFTQWFHLHEAWIAQQAKDRVVARRGNHQISVESLGANPVSIEILRGVTEPKIQGWISTKYLKRQPNEAIGISAAGRQVTFVTLFRWHPNSELENSVVSLDDDFMSVCWRSKDEQSGFSYHEGQTVLLRNCD